MNRQRIEKELIRDEGMILTPYYCSAGKKTIGVGRNIESLGTPEIAHDRDVNDGITEAEAMTMLRNDINRTESELKKNKWFRELDERRKESILNMAFNLGTTKLMQFKKMISAIENGDYNLAAEEMLDSKWSEQVGERATRLANIMRSGK